MQRAASSLQDAASVVARSAKSAVQVDAERRRARHEGVEAQRELAAVDQQRRGDVLSRSTATEEELGHELGCSMDMEIRTKGRG